MITILKKCPFCGDAPERLIVKGKHGYFGFIKCNGCGSQTRTAYIPPEMINANVFESSTFKWLEIIWDSRSRGDKDAEQDH